MQLIERLFLYFSIVFISVFAHPLLTYEFSTSKYGFLLIFMMIIISIYFLRHVLKNSDLKIQMALPHWGWVLFGLSALISTLTVYSQNPHYFRYSLEIGLYAFFTVFMVIYLSNAVDTKRKVTHLLLAAMFSGFLVAIEAFMNYYTGHSFFLGSYGEGGKMAMKAAIGNVNFVSDYLASLLPVAVYFAISYNFGWKNQSKQRIRGYLARIIGVKVFSLVCFSMFLIVVLLSGTRGVFLSLIFGFLIVGFVFLIPRFRSKKLAPTTNNKRNADQDPNSDDYRELSSQSKSAAVLLKEISHAFRWVIVVLAVLLIGILSIPNNPIAGGYSVAERTLSIFDAHGFQVTGGNHRFLASLSSVYQWKEMPFIGKGIGTYQLHAVTYMGAATQDFPQFIDAWSNFKRTHNDYAQVLSEMGLFGIISVVLTLVGMVVLFFKMRRDLENPDDTILLAMIAVGFIQMLGHSATEFPLHLLPNAYLAIIFGGVGMGRYFNKKNRLGKVFALKYPFMMGVFCLFLIVGFSATILKWQSVSAEVYFKQGSSYYSGISQYQRFYQQALDKKREIETHMNFLESRTENYAVLQPDVYIAHRLERVRQENPNIVIDEAREAQLRINFLQELENVIRQEEQRLRGLLAESEREIAQMVQGAHQMFHKARSYFLKSLDATHCYGKSTFYLSLLMVSPTRREEILNAFNTASDPLLVLDQMIWTGWDDTRYIEPQFREFPFMADLSVIDRVVQAGYPLQQVLSDFRVTNLIDGQRFRDQIDYLETTFLSFNEKNAYKMAGQAFLTLRNILINQSNTYKQIASRYPEFVYDIGVLQQKHSLLAEEYFQSFQEWFDQAIFIMPGNWNMFADQEHIYREYIEHLVGAKPISEVYLKVKEVSEKRVWASKWMIRQNRDGVPNDIIAIYRQIADALVKENLIQEAVTVLDDIVAMMEPIHSVVKEAAVGNPFLSNDQKEQFQLFLRNYEDIRAKRHEFLSQVIRTYESAENRREFEIVFLDGWRQNHLTKEQNDSITYQQIMEALHQAQNRL